MTKNKFFPITTLILAVTGLILTTLLMRSNQNVQKKAAENSAILTQSFEGSAPGWTLSAGTSFSTEQAKDGSYSLKTVLSPGGSPVTARYNFVSSQQGTVTIYFYDTGTSGGGAGIEIGGDVNGVRHVVTVGVKDAGEYYYRVGANDPSNSLSSLVPRSVGWHKFELIATPKGSYARIDGISLSWLPSGNNGATTAVDTNLKNFNYIQIFSTWNGGTFYWDNLSVVPLPTYSANIADREKHFLEVFANIPLPPDSNFNDEGERSRSKAIRALILTILNRNSDDTSKAIDLLKDVATNYAGWGKQWISPTTAAPYALATWLLWPNISGDTQSSLKQVIINEANYWLSQNPGSQYQGETKAEENSWTAGFLAIAANMFPHYSNSSQWEAKARLFAFHSFSNNESYGGFTTQNVYPNFLVDSHNWHPSPNYGPASFYLLAGALTYPKTSKNIPEEFKHNLPQVWEAHKPYINFNNYLFQNLRRPDGQIDKTGKDDWNMDARYLNGALAWLGKITGNYQDLTNLLDYEMYISPDYMTFPVDANLPSTAPSYNRKYERNAVSAWNHAYSYLILNDNLKLPPTECLNSWTYFNSPAVDETLVIGKSYTLSGWSLFCAGCPNPGGMFSLDIFLCPTNGGNCSYLGRGSYGKDSPLGYRPDTLNYCANSPYTGWSFDWTVPTTVTPGKYNLVANAINSADKDSAGHFLYVTSKSREIYIASAAAATPTPVPTATPTPVAKTTTCYSWNYFNTPDPTSTTPLNIKVGDTYTFTGWAIFCDGCCDPRKMYAVDLWQCQPPGTTQTCKWVGSATLGGYRSDTLNYCGGNPGYNGWSFQWTVPADSLLGPQTIWSVAINSSEKVNGQFKCTQWKSSRTLSVVPATPTTSPITSQTTTTSPTAARTTADLTGDGKVDEADYAVLMANFGKNVPAGTLGDLTGDGKVDEADYAVLMASFGR